MNQSGHLNVYLFFIYLIVTRFPLIGSGEPPDVSGHKNLKLLPTEDCGYSVSPDRIRNGEKAALNEFPWMALLAYETEKGEKFLCGGAIINKNYILTAAHCVTDLTSPLLYARVGEHDIGSEVDCEEQEDGTKKCNGKHQNVKIEEIHVHPDFSSTVISCDIALLRVQTMDLSRESARPVCLPLNTAAEHTFKYGIVTGWGITGENGETSDVLMKVSLPIVPLDECSKKYTDQPKVSITEKQICAGGKHNKDSCPGDSGGPLQAAAFYNDDISYVIYGVVSFGPKYCGMEGFPGVYTNVKYYMDWILDCLKP